MNNLKELEKKYEELGKEIERLKKEQETVGFKDDLIFLLSMEEYKKYKEKIPQIKCRWWLRSPHYFDSDVVTCVGDDDSINYCGHSVYFDLVAVRPALKICRTKDMVVFNGVTWIKIDEDLYISELPIAYRRFDEKSNNYETSEVRKFLLKWFEERKVLN